MKRYLVIILSVAMVLCFTAFASAYTTNATMGVAISVAPLCNLTVTNMVFPSYNNTDTTASVNMDVNCANGVPYNIDINGGNNQSGDRGMSDGLGHRVGYNLYTDGGNTQVWGQAPFGAASVNSTGGGYNQSYTIFGKVPGGQSPPVGNYNDNVIITLSY